MERKIIQISSCHAEETQSGTTKYYYHYVTALCDDGSVWRNVNDKGWARLKNIPQDEPSEPTPTELIVCAAIKFIKRDQKDVDLNRQGTEIIIPMVRHYSPDGREVLEVMRPYSEGIELKEIEQGFITNFSRFVNRKEALEIAKANNQLRGQKNGPSDILFSEDLY